MESITVMIFKHNDFDDKCPDFFFLLRKDNKPLIVVKEKMTII